MIKEKKVVVPQMALILTTGPEGSDRTVYPKQNKKERNNLLDAIIIKAGR